MTNSKKTIPMTATVNTSTGLKVLRVQWCGSSILVFEPNSNEGLKSFSTRSKDFVEKAVAWAVANGAELANVRDGRVWL